MSRKQSETPAKGPNLFVRESQREEVLFFPNACEGNRLLNRRSDLTGRDGLLVPAKTGVMLRPNSTAYIRAVLDADGSHVVSLIDHDQKGS